jgi:hypothetical protein
LQDRQVQKMVEESYQGHFDDVLRARHTLWAQTFRLREFSEAITSCFKAILSHELVAEHPTDELITPIKHSLPAVARFPKPDES